MINSLGAPACCGRPQVPAPNGNHRIMFSRLGVWTGATATIFQDKTNGQTGKTSGSSAEKRVSR